jgi:hypothetical protein
MIAGTVQVINPICPMLVKSSGDSKSPIATRAMGYPMLK